MSAHRLTDCSSMSVSVSNVCAIMCDNQTDWQTDRQTGSLSSRNICSWLNRLLACPRPDPTGLCLCLCLCWALVLGPHSNYRLSGTWPSVAWAKTKAVGAVKIKVATESIGRQTWHVHLPSPKFNTLASRTTFTNRNNDYNLPCTSHTERETWSGRERGSDEHDNMSKQLFHCPLFVALSLTAWQATTCSHLIIRDA